MGNAHDTFNPAEVSYAPADGGYEPEPCQTCDGSGQVFVRRDSKGRIDYIDGSPTADLTTCDMCRGEGVR